MSYLILAFLALVSVLIAFVALDQHAASAVEAVRAEAEKQPEKF